MCHPGVFRHRRAFESSASTHQLHHNDQAVCPQGMAPNKKRCGEVGGGAEGVEQRQVSAATDSFATWCVAVASEKGSVALGSLSV